MEDKILKITEDVDAIINGSSFGRNVYITGTNKNSYSEETNDYIDSINTSYVIKTGKSGSSRYVWDKLGKNSFGVSVNESTENDFITYMVNGKQIRFYLYSISDTDLYGNTSDINFKITEGGIHSNNMLVEKADQLVHVTSINKQRLLTPKYNDIKNREVKYLICTPNGFDIKPFFENYAIYDNNGEYVKTINNPRLLDSEYNVIKDSYLSLGHRITFIGFDEELQYNIYMYTKYTKEDISKYEWSYFDIELESKYWFRKAFKYRPDANWNLYVDESSISSYTDDYATAIGWEVNYTGNYTTSYVTMIQYFMQFECPKSLRVPSQLILKDLFYAPTEPYHNGTFADCTCSTIYKGVYNPANINMITATLGEEYCKTDLINAILPASAYNNNNGYTTLAVMPSCPFSVDSTNWKDYAGNYSYTVVSPTRLYLYVEYPFDGYKRSIVVDQNLNAGKKYKISLGNNTEDEKIINKNNKANLSKNNITLRYPDNHSTKPNELIPSTVIDYSIDFAGSLKNKALVHLKLDDEITYDEALQDESYKDSLLNGLVGYWKLDDNASSTLVKDYSGNGFDGVCSVNTNTLSVDTPIGKALDFSKMPSGNTYYSTISATMDSRIQNNEVTMMGWIFHKEDTNDVTLQSESYIPSGGIGTVTTKNSTSCVEVLASAGAGYCFEANISSVHYSAYIFPRVLCDSVPGTNQQMFKMELWNGTTLYDSRIWYTDYNKNKLSNWVYGYENSCSIETILPETHNFTLKLYSYGTNTFYLDWVNIDRYHRSPFAMANGSYTIGTYRCGSQVVWHHASGNYESIEHSSTRNTLYHLAYTYSLIDKKVNVFINGILSQTVNLTNLSGLCYSGSTNEISIGRKSSMNSIFPGYVSHVKYYNRVLSNDEILNTYKCELRKDNILDRGKNTLKDGLLCYYKLDDNNTSTVVKDYSGNGYDGICSVNTNTLSIDTPMGKALDFTKLPLNKDTTVYRDLDSSKFNFGEVTIMGWSNYYKTNPNNSGGYLDSSIDSRINNIGTVTNKSGKNCVYLQQSDGSGYFFNTKLKENYNIFIYPSIYLDSNPGTGLDIMRFEVWDDDVEQCIQSRIITSDHAVSNGCVGNWNVDWNSCLITRIKYPHNYSIRCYSYGNCNFYILGMYNDTFHRSIGHTTHGSNVGFWEGNRIPRAELNTYGTKILYSEVLPCNTPLFTCMTYNASTHKLCYYVNGALKGTLEMSGYDLIKTFSSLSIGQKYTGDWRMFTGWVKNFKYYNRALSDDEILRTYTLESKGYDILDPCVNTLKDGLIGYWKCNDNTSSTLVRDYSGHSNHGTCSVNTDTISTKAILGNALDFTKIPVDNLTTVFIPLSTEMKSQEITYMGWICTYDGDTYLALQAQSNMSTIGTASTFKSVSCVEVLASSGAGYCFDATNITANDSWKYNICSYISVGVNTIPETSVDVYRMELWNTDTTTLITSTIVTSSMIGTANSWQHPSQVMAKVNTTNKYSFKVYSYGNLDFYVGSAINSHSYRTPMSHVIDSLGLYAGGAMLMCETADGYHNISMAPIVKYNIHHIAVTFSVENKRVRLYKDGVLITSKTDLTNNSLISYISTANNYFLIGQIVKNSPRNFTGWVNNVKFYNRELSTDEIKLTYDLESSGVDILSLPDSSNIKTKMISYKDSVLGNDLNKSTFDIDRSKVLKAERVTVSNKSGIKFGYGSPQTINTNNVISDKYDSISGSWWVYRNGNPYRRDLYCSDYLPSNPSSAIDITSGLNAPAIASHNTDTFSTYNAQYGRYLDFNSTGADNSVNMGYVRDINQVGFNSNKQSFSFSFWYRRDDEDLVNSNPIFGNYIWNADSSLCRGFAFRFFGNTSYWANRLSFSGLQTDGNSWKPFTMYANTQQSLPPIYHCILTYNMYDNMIRIYINGKLDGTFTCDTNYYPCLYCSDNIYIGYLKTNAGYFNGMIKDIMFFDKALNPYEIASIYNCGTPLSRSLYLKNNDSYDFDLRKHCLHYWPLDDSSNNTTVLDIVNENKPCLYNNYRDTPYYFFEYDINLPQREDYYLEFKYYWGGLGYTNRIALLFDVEIYDKTQGKVIKTISCAPKHTHLGNITLFKTNVISLQGDLTIRCKNIGQYQPYEVNYAIYNVSLVPAPVPFVFNTNMLKFEFLNDPICKVVSTTDENFDIRYILNEDKVNSKYIPSSWNHVCFTYSKSNNRFRYYVNNNLITEASLNFSEPMTISSYKPNITMRTDGIGSSEVYSNVTLFKGELCRNEVSKLYELQQSNQDIFSDCHPLINNKYSMADIINNKYNYKSNFSLDFIEQVFNTLKDINEKIVFNWGVQPEVSSPNYIIKDVSGNGNDGTADENNFDVNILLNQSKNYFYNESTTVTRVFGFRENYYNQMKNIRLATMQSGLAISFNFKSSVTQSSYVGLFDFYSSNGTIDNGLRIQYGDPGSSIYSRCDTITISNHTGANSGNINDGLWHNIIYTYDKYSSTQIIVKCYVDYAYKSQHIVSTVNNRFIEQIAYSCRFCLQPQTGLGNMMLFSSTLTENEILFLKNYPELFSSYNTQFNLSESNNYNLEFQPETNINKGEILNICTGGIDVVMDLKKSDFDTTSDSISYHWYNPSTSPSFD